MWRRCDLHNHTFPNDVHNGEWDPDLFVRSCVGAGVDVIAVTDHDSCERVADVAAAAGEELVVFQA